MAAKKKVNETGISLEKELATILQNLEQMEAFLKTEEYTGLTLLEKGDLKVQVGAMTIYSNILKKRLKEMV